MESVKSMVKLMNTELVSIEEAVKHHYAGDISHAVDEYRAFLQNHPDYTPVIHLLGMAYHQQHEYQLAEELLSNIHEKEPENTGFMIDLARVYSSQKRYDRSETLIEKALGLEPENAEYHYRFAVICERNGNNSSAIEHYLKVIELNNENAEIYEALGRLFAKTDNPEAAELALKNARILANTDNEQNGSLCADQQDLQHTPLVTVVIPTRSRINLLRRALDSVFNQSYSRWEAIIVNDGGDDLSELISEFAEDKRLRFLEHSFRMGPGAARNTALRVARGEVVFYLDDDDVFLPHHIKDLLDIIDSEGVDFVYADGDVILEGSESHSEIERVDVFGDEHDMLETLEVTNSIPIISCAHKRHCVEEVGFFDEQLSSNEDWDFILRLINQYQLKRCDVKSFEIKRRDIEDGCLRNLKLDEQVQNYRVIYDRFPASNDLIAQARADALGYLEKSISETNETSETSEQACEQVDESYTPQPVTKKRVLDLFNSGDIETITTLVSDTDPIVGSLLSLQASVTILVDNLDATLVLQRYMDYLQSRPENKWGHLQLALLLNHLNQYEAAALACDSALALDSEYTEAMFSKADALYAQDKSLDAEIQLNNIILTPAINSHTVYRVLQLHGKLVSTDKAIQFAMQAIQLTGLQHAGVSNHLGNLFYHSGDFTQASQYYSQALQIDNSYNDAQVNIDLVRILSESIDLPVFLALPKGHGFGWGICASYLRKELAKIVPVLSLEYEDWDENGGKYIPGVVFSSIGAEDLNTIYSVRGEKNIGYTFFERELTAAARENAAKYDLILAGSTWAVERLKEAGITNVDLLIQGVDQELYYPIVSGREGDGFFIFSGGKFEIRKGQDLVLKAMQVLQQKYDDIVLVNAWVNFWPNSMATMNLSPYINYDTGGYSDWPSIMNHVYDINGLDRDRIITCDITPSEQLRALYERTDLGVFPNRSEGGTNLVLMEYMACAKPVIATSTTGHADIVTTDNSMMLSKYNEKSYYTEQNELFATWDEPDLDELLEKIEFAYHNRDVICETGLRAGTDLQSYTWQSTASNLVNTLRKWSLL